MSKKQIKEFVNKIESMRVKFRDEEDYTSVSLMNELWKYKRELERNIK